MPRSNMPVMVYGMKDSGSGGSRGPLFFASATTPMISKYASLGDSGNASSRLNLIDCPSGSSLPKKFLASV